MPDGALLQAVLSEPRTSCVHPAAAPLLGTAKPERVSRFDSKAILAETPAMMVTIITTGIYAVVYGGMCFSVNAFGDAGPPNGVIIWVMASGVSQFSMQAFSGLPFALTQPTVEMLPLVRAMILSIAREMEGEDSEAVLGTVLVTLSLATLCQGIWLTLGGTFGVAKWLRVVPVVVLKGALFGVAIFLLQSGIESSSTLAAPASGENWRHWGLVVVLGSFVALVDHAFHSPVTIVSILLLIAAVPQALAGLGLATMAQMRADGWLLTLPSGSSGGGVWYEELLRLYATSLPCVRWSVVVRQFPNMAGMWVTHVLCTLMDLKALEIITQTEMNLDKELRAIGIGNLMSACSGATWPVYVLLSSNVTAKKLGSRSGFGGWMKILLSIPLMFVLQVAVPRMPCALPATVAFWLGLAFLKETIIDIAMQHSHGFDVVIVAVMAVISCAWGLVNALLVGILMAIFAFTLMYSGLTPVVKLAETASFLHSNVHRSLADMDIVQRLGDRIAVIHLEGYIMFGSSPQLMDAVRPLLEPGGPTWIVLNFRSVMGLDYSAICDINYLGRRALQDGRHIVLTELRGAVARSVRNAGMDLPEASGNSLLQPGLTWIRYYQPAIKNCEDDLLDECGRNARKSSILDKETPTHEVLRRSFGDFYDGDVEAMISKLMKYFEVQEVKAEGVLWEAGDQATCAVGVVEGGLHSLHTASSKEKGEAILMEVVSVGAFVGFMSLLTSMPHTHTVMVPQSIPSCILLKLTREKFKELNAREPTLAVAVLRGFMTRAAYQWRLFSRLAAQL